MRGTAVLAAASRESRNASRRCSSPASAIGYYGNRGDEVLTEQSGPGNDFLAEVCEAWEAETAPAADAGVRTVIVRTGVVLATPRRRARSDADAVQARARWQTGLGQAVDELDHARRHVAALRAAIDDERLQGPVNLVAPNPVTNAEFAHTLGARAAPAERACRRRCSR